MLSQEPTYPEIQCASRKEISIRFPWNAFWRNSCGQQFDGPSERKVNQIYLDSDIIWSTPVENLVFTKYRQEKSVFSNLVGHQNEKSIRFLETVTSYEAPQRKLHQKFSQNAFTRNAPVTGFLRSLTGNFRRELCFSFCCHMR